MLNAVAKEDIASRSWLNFMGVAGQKTRHAFGCEVKAQGLSQQYDSACV